MIDCIQCNTNPAAACFTLCTDCLRAYPHPDNLVRLHARAREKYGLVSVPPDSDDGIPCALCANRCRMGEGERGYCGIRANQGGELKELVPAGSALAHAYLDRLPSNCCAAWFCQGSRDCQGSREQGYNLAVFFYGCSFDCFYCQNAGHKFLDDAPRMTEGELVQKAMGRTVRCVCFFGGTPEPQMSFALRAAERIARESGGTRRICWEWNGTADPRLAVKAAELSKETGGTVKFDLKAFTPALHLALCGAGNQRTLANFRMLAGRYAGEELVTAVTLLVPWYVDAREVAGIASIIAEVDPAMPYSLLVFHPDFLMDDLPVTPREQVHACRDAARKHLSRVNIGNRQLLQG